MHPNSILFWSRHYRLPTISHLTHGSTCPHILSCNYQLTLESELLYDWRFTTNQFVLVPSPFRLTTRDFFLNEPLLLVSLCNILSDGKMGWPFVKCTYRTYSMLLKILPFALHTSPLSVQDLQNRSCLSYVSYATMAA
jgi:hypothetical protein